jgi:hypothetical protein
MDMKYEYKIVSGIELQSEWQFNELGEQGFKLIEVKKKEYDWATDYIFMREVKPD